MKKVLALTHYFSAHGGGVEIVADKIADYLAETGKVKVIRAAADCDPEPKLHPGIEIHSLRSTNFIERISPLPYPLLFPSAIFKLFSLVKSADLVHIHDFLYFSNILAFKYAKLLGKKVIITQHIGYIPYKNPLFRNLLHFLNYTLGRVMLNWADRVIFISKTVEKYFREKCGAGKNIHFIPNLTDLDTFRIFDEREKYETADKLNMRGRIFLFVGRFTQKKGLRIMKQICAALPEIKFVFAGSGNDNPDTWKLPNVRVMGTLEKRQIAGLMNLAEMLLLPSYGEGFPLVVQEAIACGTPVMMSKETAGAFPGLEELILSEAAENESDAMKWIEKIKNLPGNFKTRDFSNRLRIFAEDNWGKENIVGKYLKVIEES